MTTAAPLPPAAITPLAAATLAATLAALRQPTTGGWHDSTLDLLRGLEVRDLGPVEWLDEWDGAFVAG